MYDAHVENEGELFLSDFYDKYAFLRTCMFVNIIVIRSQ